MDGRAALAGGRTLTFHNREGGAISCVIRREIDRGASCIVYAADRDNLGTPKPVRMKECCPGGLQLARREDGSLAVGEGNMPVFEARKRRMIDACRQNHALFCTPEPINFISNATDIYERGGTVSIVSA